MSPEDTLALRLVTAFNQALGSAPSRRRARHLLRQLCTGNGRVDRQVRDVAQVVFGLAMARPLLLRGHPAGLACAGARN